MAPCTSNYYPLTSVKTDTEWQYALKVSENDQEMPQSYTADQPTTRIGNDIEY